MANIPNFLTLLRIAAVPVIVWLLRDTSSQTAFITFGVYFVATITDFFDGYIARRYGQVSALGKLLDPLADKLLVISSLVMLALMDRQPSIPDWLLVVIISRELAVTGLRSIAATEGIVLGAEATGKLKMILQSIGIHALILHYSYFGVNFHLVGLITLLASTVVGLWSAVEYHIRVFKELSSRGSVRG